jgi:hypothetical protein
MEKWFNEPTFSFGEPEEIKTLLSCSSYFLNAMASFKVENKFSKVKIPIKFV